MTNVGPERRLALVEYIAHLSVQDWAGVARDLVNLGFTPEGAPTPSAALQVCPRCCYPRFPQPGLHAPGQHAPDVGGNAHNESRGCWVVSGRPRGRASCMPAPAPQGCACMPRGQARRTQGRLAWWSRWARC